MKLEIPKGVAMLIRSVLNIDPEMIGAQVNEMIGKSEVAFQTVNKTLAHFDGRLTALETALNGVENRLARVLQILEQTNNAKASLPRPVAGNGLDHDHSPTG